MQERTYDLAQIRALANLTQKQAAKMLNIHETTYNRLEKHPGNITLDQALLLTSAAGIGVEQIRTR